MTKGISAQWVKSRHLRRSKRLKTSLKWILAQREPARVQEMRNDQMGKGRQKETLWWNGMAKRGRYDYILYPFPFPALPFWPRSHSKGQWAQKLVPNEPLNSHTVGGSTSFKRLHSHIVLLDRHGRIEFAGGCQKVSGPGEKSRTSFTGPNRAGGEAFVLCPPFPRSVRIYQSKTASPWVMCCYTR